MKPKVQYRDHNTRLSVYNLRQKNSVHILPPNFVKIHFNIIPSRLRSSEWRFPFRFFYTKILYLRIYACYMRPQLYFYLTILGINYNTRYIQFRYF
jgi:hypothetical protein